MMSSGIILIYIAPLVFVLFVTMGKEAYDDYKRHLRDREANSRWYLVRTPPLTSISDSEQEFLDFHANTHSVYSSSLLVGDLVLLEKDQTVPADMILLHTSDTSGTCFIRTDQLDGEMDWKLRVAIPESQKLSEQIFLGSMRRYMVSVSGCYAQWLRLNVALADAPIKDIHTFVGTFTLNCPVPETSDTSTSVLLHPLPQVYHL